jgi:protein-L-isoaspartate(D-aspartate) O-methyltransferase
MNEEKLEKKRIEMVNKQIISRGIKNKRLIEVMKEVPRHIFVPENLRNKAYEDCALPISCGQTISQPYIVAFMIDLLNLKEDEKVLEIGTGSGYNTVILAKLVKEVYTIERIKELAENAKRIFQELNIKNVIMKIGDGSKGWQEYQPYDAIIVTASVPFVPKCLLEQLKIGGRMVIPVGEYDIQTLTYIEKRENEFITRNTIGCVFVPLIGENAWSENKINYFGA